MNVWWSSSVRESQRNRESCVIVYLRHHVVRFVARLPAVCGSSYHSGSLFLCEVIVLRWPKNCHNRESRWIKNTVGCAQSHARAQLQSKTRVQWLCVTRWSFVTERSITRSNSVLSTSWFSAVSIFLTRVVMGLVRIRHSSHDFGWQSSYSVDLAGWQAKMASIEIWIPWRNAHKPLSCSSSSLVFNT